MRHFFLCVGALALAGLALACQQTDSTTTTNSVNNSSAGTQTATATKPQPATAPPTTNADGVRRVSPQEASNLVAQGKAIIVDSRAADAYKADHIKGATNMPFTADFAGKAAALPKDKLIIFYCS